MKYLYSLIGIIIPFLGTSLGSSLVFFLKGKINYKFNKLLIGFSIGVMLAASIWSLIIPSISEGGLFPSICGLFLGFIFLIVINNYTNKMKTEKLDMLVFSVTLHNIPEGMAVGVCFAGFLSQNAGISLTSAMMLSLGIALQNIPEGSIISLPYKNKGNPKEKSFLYGVLSGIVEPVASIITILMLNIVVPLLPYLLSFAAGCMFHVIFEELVPEMHENKYSNYGIIGIMIGFIIMMSLDVLL